MVFWCVFRKQTVTKTPVFIDRNLKNGKICPSRRQKHYWRSRFHPIFASNSADICHRNGRKKCFSALLAVLFASIVERTTHDTSNDRQYAAPRFWERHHTSEYTISRCRRMTPDPDVQIERLSGTRVPDSLSITAFSAVDQAMFSIAAVMRLAAPSTRLICSCI